MSPCVTHPREELEEMSKGNPPSPEGVTESQHTFVPRNCGYRPWAPSFFALLVPFVSGALNLTKYNWGVGSRCDPEGARRGRSWR